MFTWWRDGDRAAKRALVAASLGWMLDSFDVMLYALVLKSVMTSLALDQAIAGRVQSFSLIAAAAGGLVFGVVADRWGRTRAMMISVALYSIFTAACGFATSAAQLAIFRMCLGLGMGGEWASGAALVSETWPDRHRAKALAFMQSSWAIGYGAAILVAWLLQSVLHFDWRMVFYVGVLPALFTLWIRRNVAEPELWHQSRAATKAGARPASIGQVFASSFLVVTLALALMSSFTLFGYWGFNLWVPTYLSTSVAQGGIGLDAGVMSALLLANQAGTWLGYVSFGFIADAVGRKRAYVAFLLLAAALVWAYASVHSAWALLALGPLCSFFATGHFSGFGLVTAEIYPTRIRATAQGFTYNVGRIASAAAPWLAGQTAKDHGYPAALMLSAAAFFLASLCWFFVPETRGRGIQ